MCGITALTVIGSTGAEAKFEGLGTGADINPNLVQCGLSATWH